MDASNVFHCLSPSPFASLPTHVQLELKHLFEPTYLLVPASEKASTKSQDVLMECAPAFLEARDNAWVFQKGCVHSLYPQCCACVCLLLRSDHVMWIQHPLSPPRPPLLAEAASPGGFLEFNPPPHLLS